MFMLDVAVGPIILIFGLMLLLLIGVVLALVIFSIKAIRKIKTEAEARESEQNKDDQSIWEQ